MTNDTAISLKLWIVLNRALHSIEEPLRQQVEAHGLGFSEFAVLEVLLHKGALPIGTLGNDVLLSSGSMTYVVDKLERRGLLQRRSCPTDRRVVYAELTAPGRTLIETVFSEHRMLLHALMGGLEPQEKELATDLIKRLGLYAAQSASKELQA